MSNERIIYTNPDGGVSVVIPVPGVSLDLILEKDVPEGVDYEIVTTDDIPSDRTFRNAWVKGNAKVQVDLEKARAIGHDIRREERAAEFAPLDEAIAKQIPGTDPVAIEAQRQEIRDKYAAIQSEIDAAATPNEIKAALRK